MRPLPQSLRKNGFDYNLAYRDAKRAIYRQHVTENCQYFEVFQIRIAKAGTFKGKNIPEREVFPSDNDFGSTAWTFREYDKALAKFNTLLV